MTKHKLFTLLFVLLYKLATSQGSLEVKNPILSGFYPDPSIEKVGDDYYLIHSTFSYYPGLPIFHSKDLKNWTLKGHAIHRPEQLNFVGQRATRGLFAPAISHHKGTFYVVCTQVDRLGNFVITAKDPAGPWSDPVPLKEVSGIDPSIFFDEDDRAYILYNSEPPGNVSLYDGHRSIKIAEFDYKNLKVISEPRIIVNGGVDLSQKPVWIEGPHIFRKDGYYYLSAAEGGTSVNHSQVIFRTKSLNEPFVPWTGNPILTQRDLDPNRKDPITSTGHADLFIGPDNNWYAVYLAVRPYTGNHYNTGRETFLSPVTWTADGWPVILEKGKEVQRSLTLPWKEQAIAPVHRSDYNTDFKKGIDPSFVYLRTKVEDKYRTDAKGLHLKLAPDSLRGTGRPTFLGRRQMHMEADWSTSFLFSPTSADQRAGIALFQSEQHQYTLAKTLKDGKEVLEIRSDRLLAELPLTGNAALEIKVSIRKEAIHIDYREGNSSWQRWNTPLDPKFLSTQTAGGFLGVLLGMFAEGNQGEILFTAFDYAGK